MLNLPSEVVISGASVAVISGSKIKKRGERKVTLIIEA